ncbi:uncharacterized protein TRUGW13939_01768 [Talaromyces rugulosus]|uniref:ABC transporter domain-containing protein n=1 Tax=Talaromyces rugulosus TaxID=121627 RepID=A0A7H8QL73_TALRU|nr:uncharacterized protein TRUGW13939_01768 [Talaromyces rugulosus]QKX54680.1 hypothetical protein TRUGW13939_01768 [Talaromyces rugulosus]
MSKSVIFNIGKPGIGYMASLLQCDEAFGPRVNPSCRAFDFTLFFEDVLLTIFPSVIFILMLPVLAYTLLRSPSMVRRSWLLALKTAVFLCLIACHTAFLILRRLNPGIETRASLAADILNLVGAIGIGLVSWFHHRGSVKPSTLLAIFLGVSVILDIVRVRTLWLLRDVSHAAVVLTLALALKLCGLLLESLSKRKNLYLSENNGYATSGPEPFIGFWIRVGFGWLLPTMRQGYHQILSVDDLPALDYRMKSDLLSCALQDAIAKYGLKMSLTLMGTDVERIMVGFRSIHELWASLVDIGIATYLLQRQVYVACLVPSALVFAFVLVTFQIAAWSNKYQKLWIEKVEERLSVTSSILGDMRAIKMLGLSDKLFNIIDRLRQAEITESVKFRRMLISQIFFANSPSVLAPVVTFGVFVAIAAARHDRSILTAQAFTSLSLISLQTTPALALIQNIPSVVQCLSCFGRIQEYCVRSEGQGFFDIEPKSKEPPSKHRHEKATEMAVLRNTKRDVNNSQPSHIVSFSRESFGWSKSGPTVLNHIDISIMDSRITIILGPVGSGKSTLLESILGETVALDGKGRTDRNFSTAAYCSQVPWLMNGTIRDNIIGQPGKYSVDEEWYSTVLWACGLETDLRGFKEGDNVVVGSKGSSLSGGQKQRVALARAIYSRCQLILLDDIFSGVDSYNVSLISNRLLGKNGLLRKNQATVVFVTHTPSIIALADDIIVLENGRVLEFGTLEELQQGNGYVAALGKLSGVFEETPLLESTSNLTNNHGKPATDDPSPSGEKAADLNRRNGSFSVYRYFSKASGHMAITGVFAFLILCVFCAEFSIVWVDWWSSANTESSSIRVDGMYLGVYATLGVASTLCMTIACWFLFITAISNSAKNFHTDLLRTTLGATLQFCLETDVGSVINRFSQDMELVGMDLCSVAINYSYALCGIIGKGVLLAVFGKYLTVALPLVAATVYIIQRFYLCTSRQVRLLDIEAKAPVYQLFLETSDGGNTVRAFGWQRSFQQILESRLDTSQRPIYSLYCIQQLLAFVLDLLVTIIAVILVAIVVTWKNIFDAGAVGVALVTVMSFNTTLMSLVKNWTMLETSIGAVARVKDFVEGTPLEDYAKNFHTDISPNWPASGMVEFNNVVAAYKSEANPILKGISLSIKPGQKIAICGHSGSGKTSLVLTLLAMIKYTGSIKIDSVDISSLTPADLRSRINVVPQDPFLIPGTVRFNIDPYENVSDDTIVRTLQRLSLWDKVESIGGLDAKIPLTSWSVGEKQLLCLERAMVRKSSILILDEATSSVDSGTERIMQDVIDKDFAAQTVLAVVHRLRYIRHFDKVAFLQGGELVEYDTPDALLERDSAFASLYNAVSH